MAKEAFCRLPGRMTSADPVGAVFWPNAGRLAGAAAHAERMGHKLHAGPGEMAGCRDDRVGSNAEFSRF